MHVIDFPKSNEPEKVTVSLWLRKVADALEEERGDSFNLEVGVITFMAGGGMCFYYGTPCEANMAVEEIGIMEMTKNYILNGDEE
jgi:hypothetical protein